MAKIDKFIEKVEKIADQLLKDIEEHRNEYMEKLPEPINDTQKRIQQLTIDNGWLIQKLANHEVLLLEYGDRLNKMEIFIKAPGNGHLRKGIKK